MGCCASGYNEVSISFTVSYLNLASLGEDKKFQIKEISKSTFDKEGGTTLFEALKSSNNPILSNYARESNKLSDSLFYLFTGKGYTVKEYHQVSDFKPFENAKLLKIIILQIDEALQREVPKAIIKKSTKKLEQFQDFTVDYKLGIEHDERLNNPNITEDDLRGTDTDDGEENQLSDDSEEIDHENQGIIEDVVDEKAVEFIESYVCPGPGKPGKSEGDAINLIKNAGSNNVEKQSSINKLVIRNSKIEELKYLTKICKMLWEFKWLKKFSFNYNGINGDFEGWKDIFILFIQNDNLRCIDLRSSSFYDNHLHFLCKALKKKRIRYLNGGENFISTQGVEIGCKWLKKNSTLQRGHLERNAVCQFKKEGVELLYHALVNHPNIKTLNISFMDLTFSGPNLGNGIRNSKTLIELGVRGVKLNIGDFKEICKALLEPDAIGEVLDIGCNDMGGDQSGEAIAKMITENTSLRNINGDQMNINMDNYEIGFNSFSENTTITEYSLSYNSELKPKIVLNFFLKKPELKKGTYIAYNPEKDIGKELTLEEKKLIEKFKQSKSIKIKTK